MHQNFPVAAENGSMFFFFILTKRVKTVVLQNGACTIHGIM